MSEPVSEGLLILVSAPSGGGKTSLVTALVNTHTQVCVSVSHTTRLIRPREIDGENYHFVDDAVFEKMVQDGAFLEHARVFGNRYGTSRAQVEARRAQGHDVILEIDWQGAEQIRQTVECSVSVFIMPPSKEALAERLNERGQDAQAVIDSRMRDAIAEMSHYKEYGYLIVNDDFDQALVEFEAILGAERLRRPRAQQRHQDLLNQLLSAR